LWIARLHSVYNFSDAAQETSSLQSMGSPPPYSTDGQAEVQPAPTLQVVESECNPWDSDPKVPMVVSKGSTLQEVQQITWCPVSLWAQPTAPKVSWPSGEETVVSGEVQLFRTLDRGVHSLSPGPNRGQVSPWVGSRLWSFYFSFTYTDVCPVGVVWGAEPSNN
jgi:hypothetical protein